MKWKLIFTSVLVIVALVVTWQFSSWIELQALATLQENEYRISAQGWEIIAQAWPLSIFFGGIGLGVGAFFALLSLAFSANADESELRKKLKKAEDRAESAEYRARERAKQELEIEREQLRRLEQSARIAQERAEIAKSQANSMFEQAKQQIEEASKTAKHAQIEASRAKRKAENRKHAMLRHKSKAERIQ
jgi:hypothetical protein